MRSITKIPEVTKKKEVFTQSEPSQPQPGGQNGDVHPHPNIIAPIVRRIVAKTHRSRSFSLSPINLDLTFFKISLNRVFFRIFCLKLLVFFKRYLRVGACGMLMRFLHLIAKYVFIDFNNKKHCKGEQDDD